MAKKQSENVLSKLPASNSDLPFLVGKNFKFISKWADQNEKEFTKVMKALAKENPSKYADVYTKVLQVLLQQAKIPNKDDLKKSLSDLDKLRNLTRNDYVEVEEVK